MAKTEVEITPATLAWRPGTQEQVARRQMAAAERQAKAGIDGDGEPLVGKDGQRLDLYESGALWREYSVLEEPGGGATLILKDHARYVLAELGGKHKSLTLSAPYQAHLETELASLLTENAFIKEDGDR